MPEENILPQTPAMPSPAPKGERPKDKSSIISILLTIILTIVLIILGERILYDINRAFNPVYDRYGYAPVIKQLIPTAHAKTITSDLGSSSYTRQDYETYRLLLHTAIIIPIFLLSFLFYYFLKFKRKSSPYLIISVSYLIFAFWMILHLLAELGFYMIEHYKTIGVYLVLGLLIGIFTTLIVLVQKKLHRRHTPAQPIPE